MNNSASHTDRRSVRAWHMSVGVILVLVYLLSYPLVLTLLNVVCPARELPFRIVDVVYMPVKWLDNDVPVIDGWYDRYFDLVEGLVDE